MADVTVKRTEEFEAIYRGGLLKVRAGLGVTSFGIQLLRLPPNLDRYPAHDHSRDGQEEVYTALDGAAILEVGGERHRLEPGVFARVGADETRRLITEDERAVVLALGAVPGEVFDPAKYTDEGEPDPLDG